MFSSTIKAWNELVGNTEEQETRGIILMLIWMMRVDGKLDVSENDQVNDFVQRLHWSDPYEARRYVAYCIDRVKEREAGQVSDQELLDEIHAQLSSKKNRAKALLLCRDVAIADGYYDASEKNLVKLFESELA